MSIDDAGDEPDETVVVIAELDGGVIGRRSLVVEDNDEPENVAPTGAPVISGRAYADRTLLADTSGIGDADGLGNVDYEYQWMRIDGEAEEGIAGATGATYELTDADVGTSVRVRVRFTDDRGHEETLESEPVEVTAQPLVTADVNGDGAINGDDALVMYYAYRNRSVLGDGDEGGFKRHRREQLEGLSGVSDPTDEDLRALLRAANAWRSAGLDAGGDVNGDGEIDTDDALVMYYAYTYGSVLGDGDEGGFKRHRREQLGGLAGVSDPTDEDLRVMLRRRMSCAAPCDDALGRGCDPALPGCLARGLDHERTGKHGTDGTGGSVAGDGGAVWLAAAGVGAERAHRRAGHHRRR